MPLVHYIVIDAPKLETIYLICSEWISIDFHKDDIEMRLNIRNGFDRGIKST